MVNRSSPEMVRVCTQGDLRRLVDAVWLHATESAHYPSTNTADMLISAASLTPDTARASQPAAPTGGEDDRVALDAAHQIEALPNDLHPAQKTARIQLIVLETMRRRGSAGERLSYMERKYGAIDWDAATPTGGETIDDVPSCGQENDYRRARSSAGSISAEVQDTYLVGGPDLKAMSGSVESDRVIQLHFRRKATDADRAWLLEAINAKIAADRTGVGDAAQPSWQLIETAPQDGTWFVALQNGETYPCKWREEYPDGGPSHKGWFDLFNWSFEEPTHWAPAGPALSSTHSCPCGTGEEACPGPDGKPLCASPQGKRL